MRNATYFPTYSQTENVVTNAVLVLLSQVHRVAPDVFSGLLTKLTDAEYSVGPQFFNQVTDTRGPGIPDGLIEQSPFQIYFETKLSNDLDTDQIKRHFQTIRKRDGRHTSSILLGLSRSPLRQGELETLTTEGRAHGVTFASTTFSELTNLIADETSDFRLELNTLIEEFRNFISEQGLTEPSENWLIVNPCGTTFDHNAQFHMYHDQPWRTKRYCKYLGCYRAKSVGLIGRVREIVTARIEGNEIIVEERHSLPWICHAPISVSDEDIERIRDIANASPYALRDETVRYYFVDRFVETDFRKTSSGGIRGHTYFQLDANEDEASGALPDLFREGEPDIETIAAALRGKTWA